MSFREMLALISSDVDRVRILSAQPLILILFTNQGIQALIVYRFGHWVHSRRRKKRRFSSILRMFYFVINRFTEAITGIYISPLAQIGSGMMIFHFGAIIIGSNVVMGSNCSIAQGVTIGAAGRNEKRGSPIIGDRVFIAPGAKLIGSITVGDDVAVGANAVVTKSVPDRAVVAGIPAHILSYKGSFEFIEYFNMEQDERRKQSLALRDQSISGRDTNGDEHAS